MSDYEDFDEYEDDFYCPNTGIDVNICSCIDCSAYDDYDDYDDYGDEY